MKKYPILAIFIIALHFTGSSQESGDLGLGTVEDVESYIYSGDLTGKKSRKVFRHIKALAREGNAEANCMLGVLHKDGIGTALNFNKARKQFKKAHELGSGKAAYSLGYLYLKGLGNIEQNYQKAIRWFEKSDWPMARHWLAQCHYHGFGVPTDKMKGMELLRSNPIGNSQVLLAQWEHEMDSSKSSAQTARGTGTTDGLATVTNSTDMAGNGFHGISDGVSGQWRGQWQLMDWSGQKVMRSVPITLDISENGTGLLDAKITLDGNEFQGKIIENGNELIFPDMGISLRKRYTDHPSELILDYRLTSFVFKTSNIEGAQYMAGTLETIIENWSEPGPPGRLLLQREAGALDQDVLDALAGQTEHFIKVYPNPFEEDLLLHYTLERDSDVSIQLLDYYRPSKVLRAKEKRQKKGERTMVLSGLGVLKSGLYIIDMNVGADRYSRIVVRK